MHPLIFIFISSFLHVLTILYWMTILYAWLPACHLQSPSRVRWTSWMACSEPCMHTAVLTNGKMIESGFHSMVNLISNRSWDFHNKICFSHNPLKTLQDLRTRVKSSENSSISSLFFFLWPVRFSFYTEEGRILMPGLLEFLFSSFPRYENESQLKISDRHIHWLNRLQF